MQPLYRKIVRDAVVAAILDANTIATVNVTANKPWPTSPKDLPAVLVSSPLERKESMGRVAPSFTTLANITVVARTSGNDPIVVEQDLDTLAAQIHQAVLTSDAVMSIIQQMRAVHTEETVTADQRPYIAESSITFEAEFPEWFQAAGPPLAQIDVAFANPANGDLLAEAEILLPSPIEGPKC